TLAAVGWIPARWSAKQDFCPTTITAGQAREAPEFAAVRAGCEAWAEPAASAAISCAAADGEAVAAEAVAVARALMLSALPWATAVARRAVTRRRSLSSTRVVPLGERRRYQGAAGGRGGWPDVRQRGIAVAREDRPSM